MARDEQLYSGISSSSVQPKRRESLEKKLSQQIVLKPYQQVVFDEIEKIKDQLLDQHRKIAFGLLTPDDVRFDLTVLQARLSDLTTLQNRLNIILKAEK